MGGNLGKKRKQFCKIEELQGNDSSAIEDEINNRLAEGWKYQDILAKANKIYLVFLKDKP